MNEEKKIVPTTDDAELSDQSLEQVSGGGFDYKPLPPIVIPFKPMPVDDPPLQPLKGI